VATRAFSVSLGGFDPACRREEAQQRLLGSSTRPSRDRHRMAQTDNGRKVVVAV